MAKSPAQAFEDYARPLEAALACVVRTHVGRGRVVVDAEKVFTAQQGVLRLRRVGSDGSLYLNFSQRYRVIRLPMDHIDGPFTVRVESWSYHVLDRDRRDILLYH